MAPLVHSALGPILAAQAPAVAEQLRTFVRQSAVQALALAAELPRVLGSLQAAGVTVVAFKGPALAELLYRDVTRRQLSDLDFLIHQRQLPAARAALAEIGYKPILSLSPNRERAVLGWMGELHFTGRVSSIDVHWRLVPHYFPLGYDLSAFEHRLSSVSLRGHQVPVPSTEDHLLILALNANKEQWERLDRLVAIAGLAGADLDWDYVLRTARRWGFLRMVLVGLELARLQLEMTPAPAVAAAVADDPAVSRIALGVTEVLASDPNVGRRKEPGLQRRYLVTWERRRDRAAYVLRSVLVPTIVDAQLTDLPRGLGFLYSVLRLGRISLLAVRSLRRRPASAAP